MTAVSTCTSLSCRTKVEGTVAKCPTCGARMWTPQRNRISGGALLVLGVFLAGLMGYLYYIMAPSMAQPGVELGGMIYNGTPAQARAIQTLFATVALFGVVAGFYGLYMLYTGMRSKVMMFVMLGLGAAILGVGYWAMQVLPAT